MRGTRHALQNFGHIRQTVVRQVRQRAGAAVQNALHVVEYRKDDLILLADLVEAQATGEITAQHFVQ